LTVVVIAIALTLPMLFWVCTDNLKAISNNWQKTGHISLYLKSSLTPQQTALFLDKVRATDGVASANLKSADDGLKELQNQEGMQDIMRYLPENPLPAVIEVVPSLTVANASALENLFSQLKTNSEVDLGKIDMQWINRLNAILGFAAKVTNTLLALLALAVVFLIGNTLRLAIHNRHEEIRVLKLIGATDPFIARPFLYSGMWYGFAGAIFAILFVNLFMLSLSIAARVLAQAYQMDIPLLGLSLKQAYFLVLISVFLGWIGAMLTINRQLASIEPYN